MQIIYGSVCTRVLKSKTIICIILYVSTPRTVFVVTPCVTIALGVPLAIFFRVIPIEQHRVLGDE